MSKKPREMCRKLAKKMSIFLFLSVEKIFMINIFVIIILFFDVNSETLNISGVTF